MTPCKVAGCPRCPRCGGALCQTQIDTRSKTRYMQCGVCDTRMSYHWDWDLKNYLPKKHHWVQAKCPPCAKCGGQLVQHAAAKRGIQYYRYMTCTHCQIKSTHARDYTLRRYADAPKTWTYGLVPTPEVADRVGAIRKWVWAQPLYTRFNAHNVSAALHIRHAVVARVLLALVPEHLTMRQVGNRKYYSRSC